MKFFDWSKIVDLMPVALSIQTPERELLYENKKMKELFGNQPRRVCYHRFKRNSPCKFCGLNIAFSRKKETRVYVKTHINGTDKVMEIAYQPLYDEEGKLWSYIEVMHELPHHFLSLIGVVEQFNQIPYSIAVVRFGKKGSEILFNERLPFDVSEGEVPFLTMISVHWFASINQGNNLNTGFYGPLPVTSHSEYLTYASLTKIKSEDADPRLNGYELILTIFITKKKFAPLFNYHDELYDTIAEVYGTISQVGEIDQLFIKKMKRRFSKKWIEIFPNDFPILVGELSLLEDGEKPDNYDE